MVRRFFSFFLMMSVLQMGPMLATLPSENNALNGGHTVPRASSSAWGKWCDFWHSHPCAAHLTAAGIFLGTNLGTNYLTYQLTVLCVEEPTKPGSADPSSEFFPNVTNSSTETQNLTNFSTTLLTSTPYPKTSESAVMGGSELAICQGQLRQSLADQVVCHQNLQGARNETEAVKNAFEQVRAQFPKTLEYFRRWVDIQVPLDVMRALGNRYPEGCVRGASRAFLAAPWNASMAALQGMRNCFR